MYMLIVVAHKCRVQGLACDALNQLLVSAGADGTLKWWRFRTRSFLHKTKMAARITKILMHRERFALIN